MKILQCLWGDKLFGIIILCCCAVLAVGFITTYQQVAAYVQLQPVGDCEYKEKL